MRGVLTQSLLSCAAGELAWTVMLFYSSYGQFADKMFVVSCLQ